MDFGVAMVKRRLLEPHLSVEEHRRKKHQEGLVRTWMDRWVIALLKLIYEKRLRLKCARCEQEWRGGHVCEGDRTGG
jgi:hypothetical protein